MRFALAALLILAMACDKPEPPQPSVSEYTDDPSSLDEISDSGSWLASDPSAHRRAGPRAASVTSGLAYGASGWNRENWCRGDFSGTFVAAPPGTVVKTLERAKECGMSIMFVIPRRFQTVNETSPARFSAANSVRASRDYARYLPQMKTYVASGHLRGIILLDDMGCQPCWGGMAITPAQAEEAYKGWDASLPGIPLGIRVVPNWIKQKPSMAQYIDFAWAQYVMVRGDYRRYYAKAAEDARELGIKLAGGINIYHFSQPGSGRPINADELDNIGNYFLDQTWPCFGVSWMAHDGWQAQGREAVHARLKAKAAAKTNVPSCAK